MRNLKRFLSLCLAAFIILTLVPVTAAGEKGSDVTVYRQQYLSRDGGVYDLLQGTARCYGTRLTYYYSDGYFADDPRDYNTHLATMGFNLTAVTYCDEDNGYENQSARAQQVLRDIGCRDIHVNDWFTKVPQTDGKGGYSIGAAMARKEIRIQSDGKEEVYTLIPVTIRGGNYQLEWASTVTLGTFGEAKGFKDAADKVTAEINSYIASEGLTDELEAGRVKFWVVGFSRAGATANLTAKRLIDAYRRTGSQVYGYCYEPPAGGVDSEVSKESDYYTIHNVLNCIDPVPLVAPASMGFRRYGVDHYVPGFYDGNEEEFSGNYIDRSTTSKYLNKTVTVTRTADNYALSAGNSGSTYPMQRAKMLTQLAMVDKKMAAEFTDAFALYELNLVKNFDFGKAVKIQSSGSVDQELYIEQLFETIQEWAVKSRSIYSGRVVEIDGKKYCTIEEAIGVLLGTVFGDSYVKNELVSCLKNYDRLGKLDMAHIYLADVLSWGNMDLSKEEELDFIWDKVLDAKGADHRISEIKGLSKERLAELKKAIYVALDLALTYVHADNYKEADEVFPRRGTSDESMVMLGTAISLMSHLIDAHKTEIAVSWLRSYDSFYTDMFALEADEGEYTAFADVYRDGQPVTVAVKAAPGEQVEIDPGTADGLQCTGWSPKLTGDTLAKKVTPYEAEDTHRITFVMPEGNVYLKAVFEKAVVFDTLYLTVPELSGRPGAGSHGTVTAWTATKAGTDRSMTVSDANLGFLRKTKSAVAVAGSEYEAYECELNLDSVLPYTTDKPTVYINGVKLISDAGKLKKASDINAYGETWFWNPRSRSLALTFHQLITDERKALYVDPVAISVPEQTSAETLLSLLPKTVTVHTNDGDLTRAAYWTVTDVTEDTSGNYNPGWRAVQSLLGSFDTEGLDLSEFADGGGARANVTVYTNYTKISPPSGTYTGTREATVSFKCVGDEDVQLVYTTDGSDPRSSDTAVTKLVKAGSEDRSAKITVSETTRIRAVTYRQIEPLLPGRETDVTLTVTQPPVYAVTAEAGTGGKASAIPATGVSGTEVHLTAVPDTGYTFKEWTVTEGSADITDGVFTLTEDTTVIAVFEAIPKALDSIRVVCGPDKDEYTEGDSFDSTGTVIEAVYTDGTAAEVTGWSVADGENMEAGKASVTIYYTENEITKTCTVSVTVNADLPDIYTVTVNVSGQGTASADPVTAEAGESVTLEAVPAEGWHFNGWSTAYDVQPQTDGTIRMPASNISITALFEKDEIPPVLEAIVITAPPVRTAYTAGDSFETEGMEITACYEDGTTAVAEGWNVTDGSKLASGTEMVTVSYTEDGTTKTAMQPITVTEKTPDTTCIITVKTVGNGTAWASIDEGEPGTTVTLKAESGIGWVFKEWKILSGGITVEEDTFELGSEDVVIAAVFEEAEPPADRTLTGLEILMPPYKTEYTEGEDFIPAGMAVVACYSDGSTALADCWTVKDGKKLTVKRSTVTVSYQENGVTVTVQQPVTVSKPRYRITVMTDGNGTAHADRTSGEKGDKATLTAMPFEGYAFDKWQIVTGSGKVKKGTLTIGDGDVEVRACFKAKAAPTRKVLDAIRVTKDPDRLDYLIGEMFDPAGMEVSACYSDNSERVIKDWAISFNGFTEEGCIRVNIQYTENGITRKTSLLCSVTNPEPEPTPTPEPTATPAVKPDPTAEPEPTPEPTAAPTAEPTAKPTPTVMPVPTAAPSAEPTETPVAYKVIKGGGSRWRHGSGSTLSFTCNGLLEAFAGLLVDGKNVPESAYIAVSGSTVIEFRTDWLETMKPGRHTLQFIYMDGSSDTVWFRVSGANDTGDHTGVTYWLIVSAASFAAAAVCVFGKKRYGKYLR